MFALLESVRNLLQNPYDITNCYTKFKFSADMEENATKLHF